MGQTEILNLVNLPLPTLTVLAAGYLSYRLGYASRDRDHRPIDVVFLVAVFGFIANLVSSAVTSALVHFGGGETPSLIAGSLLGLLAALALAALWRAKGQHWTFETLRDTKISSADRYFTAWESLLARGSPPTMIVVALKNGYRLMSQPVGRFNDLPHGSCILGVDGSVALYVTHTMSGGEQEWREVDPSPHGDWGAYVTYIPASEITEIAMRSR